MEIGRVGKKSTSGLYANEGRVGEKKFGVFNGVEEIRGIVNRIDGVTTFFPFAR